METSVRAEFSRGARDGLPIMLGYFAVSFTLGIAARNAGLSAFQAGLASFLLNASAGEYAAFSAMAAGAGYLEAAFMVLVANARYLLMSFALSQKLAPTTPVWKRLLVGYDVTDEIFALAISQSGFVAPAYIFGAMSVAIPGWAVGTYLGVAVGNLLTPGLLSALSVGLYGMFLAVILPPARKDKKLLALILVSMALSYAVRALPGLSFLSDNMKTIVLTVGISLLAAIFFPIREAKA